MLSTSEDQSTVILSTSSVHVIPSTPLPPIRPPPHSRAHTTNFSIHTNNYNPHTSWQPLTLVQSPLTPLSNRPIHYNENDESCENNDDEENSTVIMKRNDARVYIILLIIQWKPTSELSLSSDTTERSKKTCWHRPTSHGRRLNTHIAMDRPFWRPAAVPTGTGGN